MGSRANPEECYAPIGERLQKTQDWAGLRALWNGVKRIGAVLAMAVVGGICGGFTAGLLTIWVYGIGAWVGFPVGFVLGGLLGARMAPRDSALVFVATLAGSEIGLRAAGRQTRDGLILYAAWGASYVLSTLVAFGAGGTIPIRFRYPLAVAAAWGLALWTSFLVVRTLWFRE